MRTARSVNQARVERHGLLRDSFHPAPFEQRVAIEEWFQARYHRFQIIAIYVKRRVLWTLPITCDQTNAFKKPSEFIHHVIDIASFLDRGR